VEWKPDKFIKESPDSAKLMITMKWKSPEKAKGVMNVELDSDTYALDGVSSYPLEMNSMDEWLVVPVNLKKVKKARSIRKPDFLKAILNVDDMKWERKIPLEPAIIRFRTNPIIIDGNDDDWTSYPVYVQGGAMDVVHGHEVYEGLEDTSSQFSLTWDNEALYLFTDVTDDFLSNRFATETPWVGDAVELFLDVRSPERLGSKEYDDHVFQAFFVPPDALRDKPVVKVWKPETELKNMQYRFKVKKGRGYSLEAKIPWSDLDVQVPPEGGEIGFDHVLDDMDPGDYEHKQMIWRGGANNWRDPSLFPKMRLAPKY
jgi:hypothetical protein